MSAPTSATGALRRRLCPGAQVHSFEIVPDTADLLHERVQQQGLSSVAVSAFGLSAQTGTVKVAYLPGYPAGSSAAAVHPARGEQWRECAVQGRRDYCRSMGSTTSTSSSSTSKAWTVRSSRVRAQLPAGRVDVVQFEYGHLNATVRFLLGDFYELFEGYGSRHRQGVPGRRRLPRLRRLA